MTDTDRTEADTINNDDVEATTTDTTTQTPLEALLAQAKEKLSEMEDLPGFMKAIALVELRQSLEAIEGIGKDLSEVEVFFHREKGRLACALGRPGEEPDWDEICLEAEAEAEETDRTSAFEAFVKSMKKPEPDPLDEMLDEFVELANIVGAMDLTVETNGYTVKAGSRALIEVGPGKVDLSELAKLISSLVALAK